MVVRHPYSIVATPRYGQGVRKFVVKDLGRDLLLQLHVVIESRLILHLSSSLYRRYPRVQGKGVREFVAEAFRVIDFCKYMHL